MNRLSPLSVTVGPDHSVRSSEIPAVTPIPSRVTSVGLNLRPSTGISSLVFSYRYKLLFTQLLSFQDDPNCPACATISPRNAQCSRVFPPYLHSFHELTDYFACKENSTALFSAKCELFRQNDGGGTLQTCLATCAPKRQFKLVGNSGRPMSLSCVFIRPRSSSPVSCP